MKRKDWLKEKADYEKESASLFRNLDAGSETAERALKDIAKGRERVEEAKRRRPLASFE